MLPPIIPLTGEKSVLRLQMAAERKVAAKKRPDAGKHAAANFMAKIDPAPACIVSLYYPIKDELDTEPLAAALVSHGAFLALPVVTGKNAPLVFRGYTPGDVLEKGAYGAMIPTTNADIVRPQIVVLPMLGFDRRGGRLGYGGGYYDRTLSMLRAEGDVLAVGYAFGAQEVDAVPTSSLDQSLDWVVTERGVIKC